MYVECEYLKWNSFVKMVNEYLSVNCRNLGILQLKVVLPRIPHRLNKRLAQTAESLLKNRLYRCLLLKVDNVLGAVQ